MLTAGYLTAVCMIVTAGHLTAVCMIVTAGLLAAVVVCLVPCMHKLYVGCDILGILVIMLIFGIIYFVYDFVFCTLCFTYSVPLSY